MNDDIREKLYAYLDGALPDAERRAVEVEISRSEELRLELEALRAVSNTIKSLSKEKLPAGFMTRLGARRAREDSKPTRDYFILPPAYRPLAFALSTAVVALVVWDKTRTPSDIAAPRVGWDSEKIAVKTAAQAPPSIDVTDRLASLDQPQSAKQEAAVGGKIEDSPTFGKHISAPGKPLELAEAPARDKFAAAGGEGSAFLARNEEERSIINERLYKGFEEEKKRMGIARVIDKADEPQNLPAGGRELMSLQATPNAARVDSGVAAVRGDAKAKHRSAPLVKALALKSAAALQAAWAAAGLPGEPPTVHFPDEMAVFLSGPQGCGIVTVQNRKKFIVVLYKDAGFDDASARVRAMKLSAKPVVIKPAE